MLRRLIGSILIASIPAAVMAQASPDEFVVGDIRVEGLQRISEGTVYNYLPVNIGDRFDRRRLEEAARALFATGFFRDLEFRRDGNTLVVAVLERPSIESFEIKGNKDIKTEDLQKSLRNVGLAAGKIFDRSVLEEVKGYLTDQYFSRGKYAVKIDARVDELPGNRVKVAIDIVEGKRARIRQINIVGNTKFSDDDLLESFKLKTPNWLSWYKQDDRYSRESLQADLETLRSYYQDRGYANFDVESTQVAIAPEKDDIFITINVKEGALYTVGDVKLAGNLVVPETQLKQLLLVRPGQVYSRKMITDTQELMKFRLGADGYAFAKIDPVPQEDKDGKKVNLTFFVDPGNRAYVRRVNFVGTTAIDDEVLRREVRQLEGSYLSNALVDRSKERLQRLPYIEKVESETKPVPATPDLVDVDFSIKEGLPGQFSGGIGYSGSQGVILNGSFVHSNFMGRGQRVAVDLGFGKYSDVYSFSHTNPYTNIDGVSRTIGLQYRKTTQFVSAASDFSTETMSASLSFAYPLTEFQSVSLGGVFQGSQLLTDPYTSAAEAVYWVQNNGRSYTEQLTQDVYDPVTGGVTQQTRDIYGTKYRTFELVGGWAYDTRNRALFANRGRRHSVSLSATVPGSQVDYYSASYEGLELLPLWGRFTLALAANIAFGDALSGTTSLPPFRQYFAGGPDTVRGFKESRLGPKDSFGNPYGGNLKTTARAEVIFPVPEKWQASTRISAFFDIGNVFSTGGVNFVGRDGVTPVDYRFDYNELKQSVGLAVQWLAPMGIFRFSYGWPLNANPGDNIRYPEETERFQFTVGSAF